MKMIYVPPALVGGALASDAAANLHVPLEYYLATLVVLGTLVTVLKTWEWTKGKMSAIVVDAFSSHAKDHKRIDDKLDAITEILRSLPCNRLGVCDDRGFVTRVTPIGLPAVKKGE